MVAKHEATAPGETAGSMAAFEDGIAWRAGSVAGATATVVMGLFITVMNLATLRDAIAGLYGFESSLVVGWTAHLVHGTLFGLLFAFVLADPTLTRIHRTPWKTVAAGIAYGLALAIAGAGIIMPIWLTLVGFSAAPSLPFVTPATIGWHLVYGIVLGGAYAGLAKKWPSGLAT